MTETPENGRTTPQAEPAAAEEAPARSRSARRCKPAPDSGRGSQREVELVPVEYEDHYYRHNTTPTTADTSVQSLY